MVETLRNSRVAAWAVCLGLGSVSLAGCGGGSAPEKPTSQAQNKTQGDAVGAKTLLRGSNHRETQQFGADTFRDYDPVVGVGPRLPIGKVVVVDCLATGSVEAAPSADGKWYHIIGPKPYATLYAAANTFENGDTSGPVYTQPETDPNVPDCP